MRRRRVIAGLLVSLVAPLAAEGQQAAKVWRIAYLGNSSAALESELVAAFRQGLRDLSYVEGRNIVIEYRWAEGQYDRFPGFVAEAAQSKVDVIVTAGTPAILAAKEGTRTIPIVMAVIADPIAAGVVSEPRAPRREHHGVGLDDLSFAKTSSISVDDSRCSRDRPRNI